ncbi:MAG: hypothetical protein ABJN34_16610 [Litoreibacter sp.]|uniref:hypothetical protein n=1 Tax=Litoreibacter sp. TaxID=1969459 RepID=UPI0032993FCD
MTKAWISLSLAFMLAASGVHAFEDLKDRARWKSFGVENWTEFDPNERASPSRGPVKKGEWKVSRDATSVVQLKSLIALAEAGSKQYDAVHVSASKRTPKRPTQMTLAEIDRWTRATPGQPHAIGRYQFIPSTLRSLTRRAGFSKNAVFSPQVQDRLADLLLIDAGINRFAVGQVSRAQFMDNLALIWAGLPKRDGKSAYHNYAGNRATITRSFFDREMKRIFK